MKIKALATLIHESSKEAGWYNEPRTPLEFHMLIVSEVAEATEAVRNNKPPVYHDAKGKPEGEAVELADALIRILDYMEYKEWPIEQIILDKLKYNKTRGYKHGGKAL
jgi:NTP pyrophosphatase (non-canonical NTP hydrolase)